MGWRWRWWVLAGVGLVWGLSLAGQGAIAQITQATVTDILDGHQVYIQDRQAAVNSVAQQRQQVRTAASRAELRFNTGAIARLAHNSSLTVGACAQLNRGTLLVNGPLNGCTSSTLAGVRGTLYTLEIDAIGSTTIRVFEGEVAITALPEGGLGPSELEDQAPGPAPPVGEPVPDSSLPKVPVDNDTGAKAEQPSRAPAAGIKQASDVPGETVETPPADAPAAPVTGDERPVTVGQEPVTVMEGEQITIAPAGDTGTVRSLTADDFISLLNGTLISDFASELPGLEDLESTFNRLFPGIPFPLSVPALPLPSFSFPF